MKNLINFRSFQLKTTLFLFIVLLLTQCNKSNSIKEIIPEDKGFSNFRIAGKSQKEVIDQIQNHKSFKELIRLMDTHRELRKTKKISLKKISSQEVDLFHQKLNTAKTKDDILIAFGMISSTPEDIVNHLEKSYIEVVTLSRDLISLGADKNQVKELFSQAIYDFYDKRNKTNNAKLDCAGACSQQLNISLSAADQTLTAGLVLCAFAGTIGYGAAIFSGPIGWATIGGIAAGETACIGGVYWNYSITFNAAILSFDTCWMACA